MPVSLLDNRHRRAGGDLCSERKKRHDGVPEKQRDFWDTQGKGKKIKKFKTSFNTVTAGNQDSNVGGMDRVAPDQMEKCGPKDERKYYTCKQEGPRGLQHEKNAEAGQVFHVIQIKLDPGWKAKHFSGKRGRFCGWAPQRLSRAQGRKKSQPDKYA